MTELAFSFTDCAVIPQEPVLAVPEQVFDGAPALTVRSAEETAYSYTERAGVFCTVTSEIFFRETVRVSEFCRTLCDAEALFNRNVFARVGGLRL